MNAASAKIHQLLVEASDLSQRTTGELAMELHRRMGKITALRITAKGVRVTHSRYIDALGTAKAVDDALALN